MPYPTSSSPTALGNIYQAADGTFTETFVIPSSAPYTHMIGAAAPYNYPVGWQIIPPSGVSNAVTITGAAHPSWVAVASAPTAGQFVYDTSISPTGGTLTFSAADAGQSVTATWIGSTDVNKALVQAIITALKDTASAAAAPGGLATLNGSGAVVQDPASKGQASGVARLDASKNLVIENGGRLTVPAQTGNTSATYVPNLTLGWFGMPAGNADGSTVVVSNAAVTANSAILLQVQGNPGADNVLTPKVCARNAGTSFSFTVHTRDGATTSAAVDILYIIVN